MKSYSIFFLVLFFQINITFAQQAGLDLSFGNQGFATADDRLGTSTSDYLVHEVNGSTLVFGYPNAVNFALVRYTRKGLLDSSFGNEALAVGNEQNWVYPFGLAVDNQNRIYAGGIVFENYSTYYSIYRFTENGFPDDSYGDSGKVVLDNFALKSIEMQLQPDGKMIAILQVGGEDNTVAIKRLNNDGSVDTAFGIDGEAYNYGNMLREPLPVIFQPDGKIVLCGTVRNQRVNYFSAARYNTDGTNDQSFGNDGSVLIGIDGTDESFCYAAVPGTGKKIVLIGKNNANELTLVGLDSNGVLDDAFSNAGKSYTFFYQLFTPVSAALQTDGKIVVLCNKNESPQFIQLIRYNSNGSLDSSFGLNGAGTISVQGTDLFGNGLALEGNDTALVINNYGNLSVLRCVLSELTTGIKNIASSSLVFSVSPDPVLQNATVNFTLSKDEEVSLQLYDEAGKLCQSFLNHKRQPSGKHLEKITLEQTLPSGNYELVLSDGLQKEALKIVKR